MKRQRILPWALALLDDGLRLYRRHFLSFLMVAAVVMVPFQLLGLFLTGFVRTQLGEDWAGLGALLISLVQYPIVLYACLALSRAAARALDDMPVRLGQVLRIGPVRAVGMGCHGLLLSAITGTFSGIVVISVACPL